MLRISRRDYRPMRTARFATLLLVLSPLGCSMLQLGDDTEAEVVVREFSVGARKGVRGQTRTDRSDIVHIGSQFIRISRQSGKVHPSSPVYVCIEHARPRIERFARLRGGRESSHN